MRVYSQNFITFKAISLDKDEKMRSDNLLRSMDSPAQKEEAKLELFDIFDKHLQKEAEQKSGKLYYQEDFLQKLYLTFLESLENVKALTTDNLLKILNDTKPDKDDLVEDYRIGTVSIDQSRSSYEDRTMESMLSEEKILRPISSTSPEERTEQLKNIQNLAEPLSTKEQDLLTQRATGKSYRKIAEEKQSSPTFISHRIKSAIAKIQLKNNTLPKEYKLFAEKFIETFDLNLNLEDGINFIINNIALLSYDIDKLNNNIETTSKLLEIDRNDFIQTALKQPQLFYLKSETILNNIDTTAKLIKIDRIDFIQAALKQPSLFLIKPETIFNNINTTAKLLEIDRNKFITAALKQPSLFYQKPETIFNNIDTTAKLLEIDRNKFITAALKQPPLFYLKPETIFNNADNTAKLLEIDKNDFIQAALKQSSLFYQKSEKIFNNADNTAKLLEIDRKDFISAALRQPQLFIIKPETIFNNVNTTAKLLGIDRNQFITAALKQPSLFHQRPKTIFNNVDTTAKLLGIDRNQFITAALKQPQLFYQKSETIFNNANTTAKLLDINTKEFVLAALIKPQLFCLKPKTLAKKVNIIKYYKQIQGKDNTQITFSTLQDKKLYYNILAYLIKKHDGLKKALSEKELINYLKTQNKIYNLSIPQNELFEEFTKYAHDFSQSNLSNQIFRILSKTV